MKKPKEVGLLLEVENDQNISRVEVDGHGELHFYDLLGNRRPPPSAKRVVSHERGQKRPKIRSQNSFRSTRLTLTGADEYAEYDQVVVIDCGQTTFPWRDRIAFACAVRLKFVSRADGVEIMALEDRCRLYEFRGYSDNPERLAILTLVGDLTNEGLISGRACIVNDSDLGLHGAINARSQALFGEHFLPHGWDLQYAGDVGQEAVNSVVRLCDSGCRTFKHAVAAGDAVPPELMSHPLVPGVTFRRAYRDGLRIENGLISRIPLLAGTTLQAWGIVDGASQVELPITFEPHSS